MTIIEWNKLTPAQQSTFVAEKVMGWEYRDEGVVLCRDGVPIGWHIGDKFTWHASTKPHERDFVSDICAAFQVVEKMHNEGWSFECSRRTHRFGPKAGWSVRFQLSETAAAHHIQTLPEAICIAALIAVGSIV